MVDNTISCSVGIDSLLIRTLALIGFLSILTSFSKGLFMGIGYPIAYIIGTVKWIITSLKNKPHISRNKSEDT